MTVDKNLGGVELLLMCLDLSREMCGDCLVDCDVVLCDNDEEGPWDMCFDNGDEVVDCLCATEKVMNETMMCVENFCEKGDQLIFSHENHEVCDDDVCEEMNLVNLSFPHHTMLLSDPNVWLADMAATVHTTPHRIGLIATKGATAGDSITVGNGTRIAASVVGDISGIMCDQYGVEIGPGKLHEVSHLPDGKFNLFSVLRLQNEGWLLHGDKDCIWMTKEKGKIVFDIKILTPKGAVYAMYFKHLSIQGELANGTTDGGSKLTIGQAHARLGHIGEDAVCKIVGHIRWQLTRGQLMACEACAVGKARQWNLGNHSSEPLPVSNCMRVFLDILLIKKPESVSGMYKPHLHIVVMEAMQLKFVHFFETKDGMVEPTCELFSCWKHAGHGVEIICLDNAGENLALQNRCNSATWQLGIKFEFTARDTPQQNSLEEVGIFTLANCVWAMMHYAHVPLEYRYKLFRDCYATAAMVNGLMIVNVNGKFASGFEHFCGANPKWSRR